MDASVPALSLPDDFGADSFAELPPLMTALLGPHYDTALSVLETADKLERIQEAVATALKAGRGALTADVGGGVLVVSQFTLLANLSKGRRPGFDQSLEPGPAAELVERVVDDLRGRGLPVETGRFGADMQVHLLNDGPVTFTLDSRHR